MSDPDIVEAIIAAASVKSGETEQRASAVVKATTFFDDPRGGRQGLRCFGEAAAGINVVEI